MTRLLSNVSRRLLLGGGVTVVAASRVHAHGRQGPLGGKAAFTCLEGRWRVTHRRRIGGAWEVRDGECVVSPVLGGLGNVDDHVLSGDARGGRASLRLFDPATGAWSSWAMGRAGSGLGPRLLGRVEGDSLVFYGAERLDDRTVNLRQAWSKQSSQAAVWTQAVSGDGGASWTTDYVMEFARVT